MDAVLHCYPALLEHVGQFAHRMLGLGRRQTIAGHKDYFVCVSELDRNVVKTHFTHCALWYTTGGSGCGAAEGAKQDVTHRAVHRPAHQDRKYEAGKAVECAGDYQD